MVLAVPRSALATAGMQVRRTSWRRRDPPARRTAPGPMPLEGELRTSEQGPPGWRTDFVARVWVGTEGRNYACGCIAREPRPACALPSPPAEMLLAMMLGMFA